jgi:RNA polymerase primary sigma factor
MKVSRYCNPVMKQLTDQQVRYAPREVRLVQMKRAERLARELDPTRSYPYREICERVTTFRPEMYPDLVIGGQDAVHDLRCFVEDLSESTDLDVAHVDEPVLTVQEISDRYNVSTKTVDRWRDRGLVSRRFKVGNRRRRIGFLKSSVESFVKNHANEVHRSARFSQLSEWEREEIVERARRLARYGGCPSEISKRLARKLKRSPETIRYTLRNYDSKHPESAVFPFAAVLNDDQKKDIYRNSRRGVPIERLARQYCRTKQSVYRIVSEMRANRLLEQPIEYMDSPEFHKPNSETVIMGPPPPATRLDGRVKAPPGLPPYLASLYSIPLLTREQEGYHFRKMNYLKFKAAKLREKLDKSRPQMRGMDAIEELLDRAIEIKNFLIRSNLRLVVSIAKRHIKPTSNFFEMVSDGNMSLIRAIEKFDYTKGNKFSTYATWAIMKNFARSIPAEHSLLERFRTGKDEVFQHSTEPRGDQFREELINMRQKQMIVGILEQLDDREKDIIMFRYGLSQGAEPQTLEQVGTRLGVTKERIRQLEARALRKLRKIAQDDKLEIPGD